MKKSNSFVEKYINKIICSDSLTVMREMPDECLDIVVTSPLYYLKNSTGNGMKACTTSGKWAGAACKMVIVIMEIIFLIKNMLTGNIIV